MAHIGPSSVLRAAPAPWRWSCLRLSNQGGLGLLLSSSFAASLLLSSGSTEQMAQRIVFFAMALVSVVGLALLYWRLQSSKALAVRGVGVTWVDYSRRNQPWQTGELGQLAGDQNPMAEQLAAGERHNLEKNCEADLKALERLRSADRLSVVSRLVSSMAHELGTPLNVISGRAMMISSDESLPQATRDHATIIAEQSQRMTRTIRELLALSRRPAYEGEPIEVVPLIERAASLVARIAGARVNIEINADRSLRASIAPEALLQLLTNLLVNGVQAMPHGGKLSVDAAHQLVAKPRDHNAREGAYVRISVRDQGVGIAAERLDGLFKPFFLTQSSLESTGLGLLVCQSVVREHGGFIEAESELGKGSTFSVYLPEREV